jgi:hypothetical protein
MSSPAFKFGDRVVHPGKAEWGEGVVTGAQPATQDGKPCQRLTVRFDRAGLKTLSTALAPLQLVQDRPEIEGALATAGSDWLSTVGSKQVQEIMTRLPERATDPFATTEQRFESTLGLFRHRISGGSLIDWAIQQSGLKDPLSRFNRHDLEEFFKRFEINRNQQLKKLHAEMQRSDPSTLSRLMGAAPAEARDALRRLDVR